MKKSSTAEGVVWDMKVRAGSHSAQLLVANLYTSRLEELLFFSKGESAGQHGINYVGSTNNETVVQ